jgi:hypothetical protein
MQRKYYAVAVRCWLIKLGERAPLRSHARGRAWTRRPPMLRTMASPTATVVIATAFIAVAIHRHRSLRRRRSAGWHVARFGRTVLGCPAQRSQRMICSKSCRGGDAKVEVGRHASAGSQRLFQHVLRVHMERKTRVHVVPRIRDRYEILAGRRIHSAKPVQCPKIILLKPGGNSTTAPVVMTRTRLARAMSDGLFSPLALR